MSRNLAANEQQESSRSSAEVAAEAAASMDRACARIAPTWPLDRFIAVNPLWSQVHQPLPTVAAELAALSGSRLLMPRAWYRDEWRQGRLRTEHLQEAIMRSDPSVSIERLLAHLETDDPSVTPRARIMDVLDMQRATEHQMSWRELVTHATSQFCASYFDDGQAQLARERSGGLFATWRRHALKDRSPSLLMGLAHFESLVSSLPHTVEAMGATALAELDLAEDQRDAYLSGLLLDLNGWASWCAYLRWTARLQGSDDNHIKDLLAIRLAWECLLLRTGGAALAAKWRLSMATWPQLGASARASQANDWLLQLAVEIAWQSDVIRGLPRGFGGTRPNRAPKLQAVFCIDVRSEVFRRALEVEDSAVQTRGFAGFFGLPIEYQALCADSARPQLPGLLKPKFRVTEGEEDGALSRAKRSRLQTAFAWKGLQSTALASFPFVETMGLFYAARLLGENIGRWSRTVADNERVERSAHTLKPAITSLANGAPVTAEDLSQVAEGMLRAMGLTHDFARLVLLAGHGSQTRNNPHAAGLDCGACCGQTGEVNARVAASLLNSMEVRTSLRHRGIDIPASTWFVAGLHNTTTDEVTLFELSELPQSHQNDVAALITTLTAAGGRARNERAPKLGLAPAADLRTRFIDRALHWAQVRPEWGLAGNAAFIVAPREHCKHLDLAGRAFLHDYDFQEDENFSVLELIMTAPMIVTHWINFQYYASTVDNLRYGCGNKVLHNVVGGHIGVFEGNGGDLRIGLALQSLHDGTRWMHAPLRLSVFIEAPRDAIDSILAKHATVRALVENEWIHMFQIDATNGAVHARRKASVWVEAKR